ncbi:MAG: FGLLP motif-containing membrane protein [Actinomycetota bacterium]
MKHRPSRPRLRFALALAFAAFALPFFSGGATLAADDDQIAFTALGQNDLVSIFLIDRSGTNRREIREGIQPAWSPDGKRLVFTSLLGATGEIVVMSDDGSGATQLTDDVATDLYPSWSPDGKKIVFVSSRNGISDLYVMNADGSNVRRLTDDAFIESEPVWSPDGSRIAFSRIGADLSNIYSISTSGGDAKRLSDGGIDSAPSWSPDGSQIAFASARELFSEIYVMARDGSSERRLTNLDGLQDPSWSPDGKQLVVSRINELLIVSSDGALVRSITSGTVDTQPAWIRPKPPPRADGPDDDRGDDGSGDGPDGGDEGTDGGPGGTGDGSGQARGGDDAQEIDDPASDEGGGDPSSAARDGNGRSGDAEERTRSEFASAVTQPDDVGWDLTDVLLSAALAILVLLLVFPADLFDNTFEEHHDEIMGWFGRTPPDEAAIATRRPPWGAIAFAAVVVSMLTGFLDPGLGFDRASLALLIGMAIFFFALLMSELSAVWRINRRWPSTSTLRFYPVAIIISAVTVLASRLVGFEPGYMYGAIVGAVTIASMSPREEGRTASVKIVVLIATALAAWGLSIPVADAAAKPDPSFVILVLDALLAVTFVGSVEVALFNAMPVRWFDGRDIWDSNKWLWLVVTAPVAFLFVHVLLAQDNSHGGSAVLMLSLFGAFGATSVAFWGYFRFRAEREDELEDVEL